MSGIRTNHFNYIFIDECAATIEPESLIPITGLAVHNSKIFSQIVLSGDHKQLGPIVESEFAAKLCLNLSMMERLMNLNQYSNQDINYLYKK